ncbi:MAG TPA: metallophosphoesterase [Solirubrobacteraceae bacterium]|nr:metallophosphoesterase [Solirubrobacteraceae bacterium]
MRARTLTAAAGTAAAAVAARALWWEPRRVRLTRHEIVLPGWPAELDGVRVALIADLHAGAPHVDLRKVERVVARVNGAAPDLVVLLGDYADREVALATPVAPEAIAQRLATLRAPTVAVLGNHDWRQWGPRMRDALRGAELIVLENDAVALQLHGHRLWTLGVADATTRTPALQDVDALPAGDPVLVLSHNPDVFPAVPPRVALTLAGHLHGGQVNVPLLRDRATPSRFGARYRAGHVEEGGRHLFVSRGIGTSRLPVRLFAAPEVALLRLAAA